MECPTHQGHGDIIALAGIEPWRDTCPASGLRKYP